MLIRKDEYGRVFLSLAGCGRARDRRPRARAGIGRCRPRRGFGEDRGRGRGRSRSRSGSRPRRSHRSDESQRLGRSRAARRSAASPGAPHWTRDGRVSARRCDDELRTLPGRRGRSGALSHRRTRGARPSDRVREARFERARASHHPSRTVGFGARSPGLLRRSGFRKRSRSF